MLHLFNKLKAPEFVIKMNILENSEICFDNKISVYKPGDMLTGCLKIQFNSPKKVRGILLEFVGKATVYWSESSGDLSSSYRNKEIYFKHEIYVVGQKAGEIVQLPAGHHVYPFQYLLPWNLPPSFEEITGTGKIIYCVKATLDRPWKMNKHLKVPFVVKKLTNIEDHPLAIVPGLLSMEKQFGILASGFLKLFVRTQNSGFVAGQNIPLAVEVYNNSEILVDIISIKLRQILTFHAKRRDRKEEKTLSKYHITIKVKPNSSISFIHMLKVPPNLILYDLFFCRIIDMNYEIKVELHTVGITKNLVGRMPLYPVKNRPQNY